MKIGLMSFAHVHAASYARLLGAWLTLPFMYLAAVGIGYFATVFVLDMIFGLFASIIDDAQHWSRHARSHNAAWLERTKVALKGY